MASMRAQLSLQFNDEELFNNFIKPYKEQRLLNNLIIKCLSAYYYDDDVRNKIEGVSLETVSGNETVSTNQEICDSIRQALAMQDFMAQELKNTMETGTEDITNILNRTNEMAEETGLAKTTETSSGSTLLRLNAPSEVIEHIEKESTNNKSSESSIDDKMNLVIKAISLLAKASGNSEVSNLFSSINSDDSSVSQDNVTMTENNLESVDEVSNEVVVNNEQIVEETEEIIEPQINQKVNNDEVTNEEVVYEEDEDATAAMQELLGSL